MTGPKNPDARDAAIQYLIWALEQIERTGNEKAANHARAALQELRRIQPDIGKKKTG